MTSALMILGGLMLMTMALFRPGPDAADVEAASKVMRESFSTDAEAPLPRDIAGLVEGLNEIKGVGE